MNGSSWFDTISILIPSDTIFADTLKKLYDTIRYRSISIDIIYIF